MDKNTLINALELDPHREGGYYRRTYTAPFGDGRATLSSIYYLLTNDSPVGRWHRNQSDIMHYWQLGAPLHYRVIDPQGQLQQVCLGPDLSMGQQLQLLVPARHWKASYLPAGDYGLISEAVTPGFIESECDLADVQQLAQEFPQHRAIIERLANARPGKLNE